MALLRCNLYTTECAHFSASSAAQVFLFKLRCFRPVLTQAAVQGLRSEWVRQAPGRVPVEGGHDLEFGELPFWVVPAHVF